MKRQEQNDSSKERILKAALQEFGEKGYHLASTNCICKNNEISKGLLFHYYKTKDDLFLICVETCFHALSAYLAQHLTSEMQDAKKVLNHYFEIRFNFFKQYPLYEQIFYTAVIDTPSHLAQQIEILRIGLNELNKNFLTNLTKQLEIKPTVNIDYVITLIYEISNYLHMKYKGDYSNDLQKKHEVIIAHSKEIQEMIILLFYGIVK